MAPKKNNMTRRKMDIEKKEKKEKKTKEKKEKEIKSVFFNSDNDWTKEEKKEKKIRKPRVSKTDKTKEKNNEYGKMEVVSNPFVSVPISVTDLKNRNWNRSTNFQKTGKIEIEQQVATMITD